MDNAPNILKHPSDFVLGLLTAHVHEIKLRPNSILFPTDHKLSPQNHLLRDWSIYEMFGVPAESNFFAVLYVCHDHSQLVLAFRGYDVNGPRFQKLKSLKLFHAIINKSLGDYQISGFEATHEAFKIMKKKQYILTFTGHSFGGWLAELAIYNTHKLLKCKFIDNIKAVTFDSPGMYDQTEEYRTNLVNSNTQEMTRCLNIVTYLAEPNLINTTHRHVGRLYLLPVKNDYKLEVPQMFREKVEKNKYLSAILAMKGCNLDTLLAEFNATTGKPNTCFEVEDWPTIKYDKADFLTEAMKSTVEFSVDYVAGLIPLIPSGIGKVFSKVALAIIPSLLPSFKLISDFEQFVDSHDPENQTNILHQFLKSHYIVLSDAPNFKVAHVPHLPGTLEWYLWKLHQTDLEELVNNFANDDIMRLRDKYLITSPDHTGRRQIVIKESLEETVEDVKDEITHLLKYVDTLAEYLSCSNIETPTETLILKMQDKASNCSIDHVLESERKKNSDLIPIVESLYNELRGKECSAEDYFNTKEVTPLHLAKFIYPLTVLASNTLYRKHDGEKAREIAKTAKNLVEQYMIKIQVFPGPVDFDSITDDADFDEMFKRVEVHLLRMYSTSIYYIGRSYIYIKKELAEGKKYFQLCHRLGKRLNTFEGYLSLGRGVAIIERSLIEEKWNKKQITDDEAEKQLMDNLDLLKEIISDDKEYKDQCKPGLDTHKIVVPSTDDYNRIECYEQEVRHYLLLINITATRKNTQNVLDLLGEYVRRVRKVFLEIFKLFNKGINPRKKASVYNMLGYIFLTLHAKNISVEEFQDEIREALAGSLLVKPHVRSIFFVKAIFHMAEPNEGDYVEYTNASTYDGLVKVCEILLRDGNFSEIDDDSIYRCLAKYKHKRNKIQKELKINTKT